MHQYDYTARRIYPLFQQLGVDFGDKPNYVSNLKKVFVMRTEIDHFGFYIPTCFTFIDAVHLLQL
jgi:hypothetical protein